MQLKLTTGYAVRILVYLAKKEGALVSSAELSKNLNISQNYILRMGSTLRNAGLIETQTGTVGGYGLKKPAEEIMLIDVISLIEGTIKLVRCMQDPMCCGEGVCETCELREWFEPLQEYLEGCLVSATIADLAKLKRNEEENSKSGENSKDREPLGADEEETQNENKENIEDHEEQ